MLNLQKEFINFHDKIKLVNENTILREKRDILLKKLKSNISDDAASYTTFNQGSYAMNTGVIPEDEDYDIDVGLKFSINMDDYTDPLEPKKWVRDALYGHTKSVEIKRSCVTVTYQKDEEALYHVDFAVYAANNDDGKMYIAKGKEFSSSDNKKWELSDPQGLIDKLKNKYSGDDAAQFRRIIRYMKKWKTHQYSGMGNEVPTGIGLTILAYDLFTLSKTYDWATNTYVYDDFSALHNLVTNIKNIFSLKYSSEEEEWCHTLSTTLPVDPFNDLFDKMSHKQMEKFYQKIETMICKLDEVKGKEKRSEACTILVNLFGNDFPITVDKSMVGTSESA